MSLVNDLLELIALFSCNSTNAVLEAAITSFETATTPASGGISLDLVGIIALYSTIDVTLNLLTMSKSSDNWRDLYNQRLFRDKLDVETNGLHISPDVIDSYRSDTPTVWWRTYLANNHTFYGDAVYTRQVHSSEMKPDLTGVTLPSKVLHGTFLHKGDFRTSKTNVYYIFQLADLNLAVKTGARKRDVQIIPFRERIIKFYEYGTGNHDQIVVTESGKMWHLTKDDATETVSVRQLLVQSEPVCGVALVRSKDDDLIAVLRRDSSVDIYDLVTSEHIGTQTYIRTLDGATASTGSLIDDPVNAVALSKRSVAGIDVLTADGHERELSRRYGQDSDLPEGLVVFSSSESSSIKKISSLKNSPLIGFKMGTKLSKGPNNKYIDIPYINTPTNLVYMSYEYSNVYFVGDRRLLVEYGSYKDETIVTEPFDEVTGRVQYSTGYDFHILTIV